MSKRETRIAKAWMVHYGKLIRNPQRGAIVFGNDLNRGRAMDDASAQGYFVADRGDYAELRDGSAA